MSRSPVWRVRVNRSIEAWVDVEATTAAAAEIGAAKVPGVISVFGRSAVRGDIAEMPERPAGVREE